SCRVLPGEVCSTPLRHRFVHGVLRKGSQAGEKSRQSRQRVAWLLAILPFYAKSDMPVRPIRRVAELIRCRRVFATPGAVTTTSGDLVMFYSYLRAGSCRQAQAPTRKHCALGVQR